MLQEGTRRERERISAVAAALAASAAVAMCTMDDRQRCARVPRLYVEVRGEDRQQKP